MVEKMGNQIAQSLLEQAKKASEKNNNRCELNLSAQNTECERDITLTEQTANLLKIKKTIILYHDRDYHLPAFFSLFLLMDSQHIY